MKKAAKETPEQQQAAFRAFMAATFEHITREPRMVFVCQAMAIAKKLGLTKTCEHLERKL